VFFYFSNPQAPLPLPRCRPQPLPRTIFNVIETSDEKEQEEDEKAKKQDEKAKKQEEDEKIN